MRLRLPSPLRRLAARWVAAPAKPRNRPFVRRACLYKVDRLGDFILATGALRRLLAHYGPESCQLVVSSAASALAEAEFPGVPLWVLPPAQSGVLREMRRTRREVAPGWAEHRFEELVCLRHAGTLYRDITLSWIAAARWRGLGPPPSPRQLHLSNQPQLPSAYPGAPDGPWSRELLAHRDVVSQAIGETVPWEVLRPRLNSVLARNGDRIAFCPFGSERVRDYPNDAWIAAWREARAGAPIDVIGSGERAEDIRALADRLRAAKAAPEVTAHTGLTPAAFVERIASAHAVVTVESAAAHLATALDKPAVVLMGGGHFGQFGPWGDGVRQHWVHEPLPCRGCGWRCTQPSVQCLELDPRQVARALAGLSQ